MQGLPDGFDDGGDLEIVGRRLILGGLFPFLPIARFPETHAAHKGYQDLLGKMHDLDVFAGIVTEAGFSPSSEQISLAAIAEKRERLFADFTGMLTATSFEELGSRVTRTAA